MGFAVPFADLATGGFSLGLIGKIIIIAIIFIMLFGGMYWFITNPNFMKPTNM